VWLGPHLWGGGGKDNDISVTVCLCTAGGGRGEPRVWYRNADEPAEGGQPSAPCQGPVPRRTARGTHRWLAVLRIRSSFGLDPYVRNLIINLETQYSEE
jgi:hypothetical protein